jgi:hypothetical protein
MQQVIAVNNVSGCIFNFSVHFSVQLLDPPKDGKLAHHGLEQRQLSN